MGRPMFLINLIKKANHLVTQLHLEDVLMKMNKRANLWLVFWPKPTFGFFMLSEFLGSDYFYRFGILATLVWHVYKPYWNSSRAYGLVWADALVRALVSRF